MDGTLLDGEYITSADKWIDASKELPEYTTQAGGNRFVIVIVCVNGIVTEGMYEEGVWKILGGNVVIDNNDVTHWMPKPSPPRK